LRLEACIYLCYYLKIMPFQSDAQRRFMYAQHPGIAKRWAKHTPKGKNLPEKKTDSDPEETKDLAEQEKKAFLRVVGLQLALTKNANSLSTLLKIPRAATWFKLITDWNKWTGLNAPIARREVLKNLGSTGLEGGALAGGTALRQLADHVAAAPPMSLPAAAANLGAAGIAVGGPAVNPDLSRRKFLLSVLGVAASPAARAAGRVAAEGAKGIGRVAVKTLGH
jgi:hypothetical protein